MRPKTASSSPDPAVRRYQVYGLVVDSELPLPELMPSAAGAGEVTIAWGKVPDRLDDALIRADWCELTRREFLLNIDSVARYHVLDGRRITVELNAGSRPPAADVRLWLLGSAFGALLHQRGLLPLHVSAVRAPAGAWAFTGESGEGKSTLAAFLHRRLGWPLVSDDVSVVIAGDRECRVYPGPRKLKLWQDALQTLEFADCQAVRDLSNTDKFQLYLPGEGDYRPEPLRGLVLLESADEDSPPALERLKGMEAFNACLAAVYRPYMEYWFKLPRQRMDELVRLCRQVPIYRFRRHRSLAAMADNLQPLLELMSGSPRMHRQPEIG